eukprot:scaffold7460_cov33-Tisochrysis_lutea.AAC.1
MIAVPRGETNGSKRGNIIEATRVSSCPGKLPNTDWLALRVCVVLDTVSISSRVPRLRKYIRRSYRTMRSMMGENLRTSMAALTKSVFHYWA